MRPMGKRTKGDIYITGGSENKDLHKAKYFDGKRFMVRRIYLSKSEANGAADANRAQGHLSRVVPRMVWINRAGWELGMEKVQGYVVYIHYNTEDRRKDTGLGMVMRQIELRSKPNYIETFNTPPAVKRDVCPCGSGKSPFTFEGTKRCADCAPICIGGN